MKTFPFELAMTNIEKRARFVAQAVTRQAMERGAWNQESEDGLTADIVQVQEEAAQERAKPLLALLDQHAIEKRNCLRCQAPLMFVMTAAGKRMPISVNSGHSHFTDCPAAEEFRKGKTA